MAGVLGVLELAVDAGLQAEAVGGDAEVRAGALGEIGGEAVVEVEGDGAAAGLRGGMSSSHTKVVAAVAVAVGMWCVSGARAFRHRAPSARLRGWALPWASCCGLWLPTGILARMRVDFDPAAMGRNPFYKLLTAVVVPRPIAWVSTISPDNFSANLAPHSFFSVSCVSPPIVQFTSVGRKDSLNNAEATGEFVVNLAPEPLFERINATATDFPPGVSEFEAVGIAREPSVKVAPPRVAESPVALECRLHSTLRLGDSVVVFGEVVYAAVSEEVLVDGHPEVGRMRPLSRLGKDEWGTLGEVLEIKRIRYPDWSGGSGIGGE